MADPISRTPSRGCRHSKRWGPMCSTHRVREREEIRVVTSVDRPVNVLARSGAPTVAELAALGVGRISVGGAFAWVALSAAVEAANEFRAKERTTTSTERWTERRRHAPGARSRKGLRRFVHYSERNGVRVRVLDLRHRPRHHPQPRLRCVLAHVQAQRGGPRRHAHGDRVGPTRSRHERLPRGHVCCSAVTSIGDMLRSSTSLVSSVQ